METKFLSLSQKSDIHVKLKEGDDKVIKTVFDEIQRLEAIIKDYELGFNALNAKFTSKTFKNPSID